MFKSSNRELKSDDRKIYGINQTRKRRTNENDATMEMEEKKKA